MISTREASTDTQVNTLVTPTMSLKISLLFELQIIFGRSQTVYIVAHSRLNKDDIFPRLIKLKVRGFVICVTEMPRERQMVDK